MKYLLSVITPSHNPDILQLERAFNSLKKQTLGFENIEWVIVSHNTIECKTASILAMTCSFPNVSVYVLNDGIKSAATPRNHGLERAKGFYIGFLDQDDWFEVDVFEKALKYIKETEADMVSFQFKSVCADDKVQTVPPNTLLDQTKEIIVMESESWDSSLFMHIMGLSIWSKVYKKEFLQKHSLQFDNEVAFFDDALFNIDCFNKVKRICFLPNLYGYNYFLHSESTVQNLKKTPNEVKHYTTSLVKTFEHGLKGNLYMRGVIWGYLCYIASILLVSKGITVKERKQVYRLLSPYLKSEKMPPEYALKSFGNDGKSMVKFPRAVIKNPFLIHIFVYVMKFLRVDIERKLKEHHKY